MSDPTLTDAKDALDLTDDDGDDADLWEELDAARDAADARVVPWQRRVRPGDLALSFNADIGLWVGVEVLDALHGADPDERDYLTATYSAPHMQHYRFARAYSVVCPDGELGDVHVSTLSCLVSREVWDEARAADWGGDDPQQLHTILAPHRESIRELTLARLAS